MEETLSNTVLESPLKIRPTMNKYSKRDETIRAPKQTASVKKSFTEMQEDAKVYRIIFNLTGPAFAQYCIGGLIVKYTGSTVCEGNTRFTNHFSKAKTNASTGTQGSTLHSLISTIATVLANASIREREADPLKELKKPITLKGQLKHFYCHKVLRKLGIVTFEIVETHHGITRNELKQHEHASMTREFTCLNDKRPLNDALINWEKVSKHHPDEFMKRQKILEFIAD